jgi:hypothetical protein
MIHLQRRHRIYTNCFLLALLLAILGGITMLVGGVIESNYSPYQGADFVSKYHSSNQTIHYAES